MIIDYTTTNGQVSIKSGILVRHDSEYVELESIKPEPRGLKEPQFAIGVVILLVSCLITLFVLVPAYISASQTNADTNPIINEMAALISASTVGSFVGIIWRSTKG